MHAQFPAPQARNIAETKRRPRMLAVFTLAVIVLATLGCGTLKPGSRFIPKQFPRLYIGLPFAEFKKLREMGSLRTVKSGDFRIHLLEAVGKDAISTVDYHFVPAARNPRQPLYEIIVEYLPGFDLRAYMHKKYGPPNNGKEWAFPQGHGLTIHVWQYQQRLVIAANVRGSEWDNGLNRP